MLTLKTTVSSNPETPYIEDFDCDILDDSGKLVGKRVFSLIKFQEMMDDEVGLAENLQTTTDFTYSKAVLGEDFIFGRSGKTTETAKIMARNHNFNLLVLKCLEILPEHRGKGYGKQADYAVMDFLKGRFGLAVKMASPLQFDEFSLCFDPAWAKRMKLDDLPKDKATATETLLNKYQSWGYTRIPDTAFLFFDPEKSKRK